MGYELRRWLADRLPADISSGERLVALEIADQANDRTRRAYGTDTVVVVIRRAGFADKKQLGKVLGKLAKRGIELRVPVRDRKGAVVMDSRGGPVFACNGHELNFYVPSSDECPALLKLPHEGDLPADSRSPAGETLPSEGPPPGDGRSPAWSPKVPPAGVPSPQSPQDSSSLSGPERHIVTATGATPEETREIISIINTEHQPRSLSAYVRALAANGDLEELLARVRSGKGRPSSSTSTLPRFSELAALPPCPHGMPGGARVRSGSGTPACPGCRGSLLDVSVRPEPAATAPTGPPDLSSLRSTLLSLTTRTRAERPAPVRTRQLVADELPESALAAHAYLLGRGDADVWTSTARDELGLDARRADVLMRAAELARSNKG